MDTPSILRRSPGYGYDAAAEIYDQLHRRFLRLAGAEAEAALLGAVLALLRPNLCILDAGGGTGRLSRRLLKAEPALRITLLDRSPRMLDRAVGLALRRVHGDLDLLPFANERFDLVVAAWVLDAAGRGSEAALRELERVTRRGATIALAVTRESADAGLAARFAAFGMRRRGLGQPLRDADLSCLTGDLVCRQLHDGRAVALLLRKRA